MANLPFHIPHIYHSITDSLSFSDLLKCILVNRQWHDIFIPILWTDAVTFRTYPRTCQKRAAAYIDYSLDYYGYEGMLKHAHHIRALTCQGFQSLQTLFDSFSCVNLVEINFLIDLGTGSSGLDHLVNLMSVNPSLCAISIENVDLNDKATESQLYGLLDFLDLAPSITSVCLVPKGSSLPEQWGGVWARMYSRIDRNNVHSLRIQSHSRRYFPINHLSRSKRALTDGRPWPVRETPLSVRCETTTLRRVLPTAGARWENERRSRFWPSHFLAVLENKGRLELCASNRYIFKFLWSILLRPPASWDTSDSSQPPQEFMDSMGTTLRQVFPNLRKLGFSYEFSDLLPMEKVLPSLTGLSSLSLTFVNRTSTFPLLLSTQSDALSSLTIFKEISMADFFSLVTRCPNLQDLKVSVLQHVEGPKVSPPWICKDLRKLDIHLEHRDNSYYMYDDEANGPTIEQEIASAKRLAPSLLQQLGEMTHLQDLCLGFNHEYSVGEWTFFQVSTDPVYGLPRLAGLQQLKAFKVTGVEHNAGQDEIEWMRTHWPLLVSLDMPILVKVNGRRRQARGDKFDGLAPAYEKWYPGLKVLIPESSYGCSMCLALYCDYSDQGTMYDYSPVGMSQVLEPQEREGEDEDEHEETIWALDDEYHLSKHYNVHKSEAWPKYSRRQMQCGHRY